MTSWALSGPTTSHDLPEFNWKDWTQPTPPHYGLPDTFANQFIKMKPNS